MNLALARAEPAGDRIRLVWSDGRSSERHVLQLRDGCPCPSCVDGFSSQRHVDAADIPEGLAVRAVSVGEGGLSIVWDPDGHESLYTAAQLAPDGEDRGRSRLWGRELQDRAPRARHADVVRDPRAMLAWLTGLRDYGVAILVGAPIADSEVERVAELYGYVHEGNDGRHFEVISTPKPTNFAYTPKTLAVHTDRPFADPVPGVQLLHCLAQSEDGGENLLVDGFRAASQLKARDPEAFAALARIPATFRNRYESVDLIARHPVIRLDDRGQVEAVHVNDRAMRPVEAEGEDVPAFYRGYRAFVERLRDPDNRIVVKLAPGDVLAFDNRRVLHGRAGYDASRARRHLQGCYTDWCYVESKRRMIQAVLAGD
jgi:gamma-butyrobetaine dioxygenase